MKREVRRWIFRVHSFFGFYLLLLLLLIFVTGSLLLFSRELTLLGRPDLWLWPRPVVAQTSFGQIYDTASRAVPGADVLVVAHRRRPWFGDSAKVRFKGQDLIVWMRPGTTEVLGVTTRYATALPDLLLKLHVELLAPSKVVRAAVSSLALVVLVSLVTGLITYRRFWKGLLRLPHRDTDDRNRPGMWHRLLAVWLTPFLALIGITGTVFFLETIGVAATYPRPDALAPRDSRLPPDFTGADVDAAVAVVLGRYPAYVLQDLVLPGAPAAPIIVNGYDGARGRISGMANIQIDPTDLRITAEFAAWRSNAMGRLRPLVNAIHFGTWGGFGSVLLWGTFGIGGILLLVMGARVRVARAHGGVVPREGGAGPGRSVIRVFLNQLGRVRWGYLMLACAVLALALRKLI